MISKLQIFDYIEMIFGLVLGMSTKILECLTYGDIKTVFAFINIIALVVFVFGIMHMIEDKYGVKVLTLKQHQTKVLR